MYINIEYILIGGTVKKLLIIPFVTVKNNYKINKIRDKLFDE